MTITAGDGPLPAGVTSRAMPFSGPLGNVTLSSAAKAGEGEGGQGQRRQAGALHHENLLFLVRG
jgi:hypothetical protein